MRISLNIRICATFAAGAAIGFEWVRLIRQHGFDASEQLFWPAVTCGWIIATIPALYRLIRVVRWRWRKRKEAELRGQLGIPDDVLSPAAFPGIAIIERAQRAAHEAVPDFQAAMYARGITIATMPSIAVLVGALQATITAPGTPLATGLAIANVAVMSTLVGLVWRARNPSEPWVQARTRAELLRREQYLCLAHIGPYQNIAPDQVDGLAALRVATISGATANSLDELIPLRADGGVTSWHDQIFLSPNPVLPDLVQRVRSYLFHRITKQHFWFASNASDNRHAERRAAAFIKFALLGAVAATMVQAAVHLSPSVRAIAALASVAGILTLVLPPACAFLIATQELFSHRRLAVAYDRTTRELTDAHSRLTDLLSSADLPAVRDRMAVSVRFQTAVLQAENHFTHELQQWRMITHRDEYDLSL